MPNEQIEPLINPGDYCVACDDYHDPDDGPCAVLVVDEDE